MAKKEKHPFQSLYFGFLSAFAILILFFMVKLLTGLIPNLSKIYPNIIALVLYLLCLSFSYNYSEYDKNLRKSIIVSSIVLWIIYFIPTLVIYLIKWNLKNANPAKLIL